MRHRSRRFLVVVLLAGLALVAGPVAVAVAQAADEPALGFFDVTADATGIGASFGDPSTQPYPTAAGLVPSATAQLGAGPSGLALSSIAWPGPLLGNAGTLANVVGTPLPPEMVANANDPVRAQATSSGGERDEQTLGPMYAVVDGADSTARTALSDFSQPSLVSAAKVVTKSRSYLDGASALAIAESQLQGIEVAGLIKIDAIRTTAKGTTDGETATTDQDVVVSGVTVQGQGATIDASGIHLGGQGSPNPLDSAVAGANEALKAFGMQAFVTKPVEQTGTGGSGLVRSGSVVFVWEPPDSGQVITVVLGGATAQLRATPGSSFDLGGEVGGSDSFASPAIGTDFASTGDLGAPAFDSAATGTQGGSAPGGGGGGGDDVVTPLDLTSGTLPSDRVPLGWMLIGFVGMAMVGSSLHGLRAKALDPALIGTDCPLERGAP